MARNFGNYSRDAGARRRDLPVDGAAQSRSTVGFKFIIQPYLQISSELGPLNQPHCRALRWQARSASLRPNPLQFILELPSMSELEPSAKGVFDVARIRQLVELMKEHELQEIDLRESDQRIRLARAGAGMQPTYSVIAPPIAATGPPASSPAISAAASASGAAVADGPHIKTINSPMVGTFYSKANPNSPPFVKVGDTVNPETVVCIIEAMKVFNEISAEIKGKIVAVLVDSETPVDFGRPLFKVDTSA
jgi:acetyl-CoA carboxylase biotin carboxyl carrier protein